MTAVVRSTNLLPNRAPAAGAIVYTVNTEKQVIRDPAGNVVFQGPLTVKIDAGETEVELPASDDPTLEPSGFTFTATEQLSHVSKSNYRRVDFQTVDGQVRYLADYADGDEIALDPSYGANLNGVIASIDEIREEAAPLAQAAGRTFVATSVYAAGIDDTGATATGAALLAFVNTTPPGSTIKMPGKYRIEAQLVLPPDRVYDMSGGRFICATAGTNVLVQGAFEEQISVTALDPLATITLDGNVNTAVAKLTLATAPGWVRGDVIKVIADDVIPAAHVTSDTLKPRVGEFATVHSVSGTEVYLQGILLENYTTNIRAARLPYHTVTFINPTFDTDPTLLSNGTVVNALRCLSLVAPKVYSARVTQLAGIGLCFKSCPYYVAEDTVTHYATDNAGAGFIGYSHLDSSCNSGLIRGGVGTGGRHFYTDGTGLVAANSPDTDSYGATIGTKVVDPTARDMKHAAFDTHHMSMGVQIINPTAYLLPGTSAILFRGRYHKAVNPTAYNGRELLYQVCQETGAFSTGESYGHEVHNPTTFGTERISTIGLRTNPNHPYYNVRDDRATRFIGGTHYGLKRTHVLVNATVRLSGTCEAQIVATIDAGNLLNLSNSAIYGAGGVLRFDCSAVATVGVNNWLINADDSASLHSIVRLGQVRLLSSAAYAAALTSGPITINSQTTEFTIEDLVFENYPWSTSTPIDATDTNLGAQNIRYRVLHDPTSGSLPATRSSAYLAKSNSAIASTLRNLFRSSDPALMLSLSISDATARTLIVLPPGRFAGQLLTIVLATINGGAGVTVTNGAGGNITLTSGANVVLSTAGQSIRAVYTGARWQQI